MPNNLSNTPSLEDVIQKIEDYGTTILAIQAFQRIAETFFEQNHPDQPVLSCIGRVMTTSENNHISQNNKVTPDLVIQVGSKFGFVIEAKKSLPKNSDNQWKQTITQLEKYDDNLQGWWTEEGYFPIFNLTLLIEVDRSIDFSRYFQSLIDNGEIENFYRPISIIEFFKKQEVKQFLRIRKVWGNLIPSTFQTKLESGISVPVEGLIDSLKYYDNEPEVEYTMVLLWQDVFNERRQDESFDEISKSWPLFINIDELTEYLQKLYGNKSSISRERTFPRRKWIIKALDAFVVLNYAKKDLTSNNYVVYFKKFRGGDIFKRFYNFRLISKKDLVTTNSIQLELFQKEIEN